MINTETITKSTNDIFLIDYILSSTGFVGRISIDLILEELPLDVCNAFWHPKEKQITAYEKFKLLSVTGGVPLYLERIKPELPAEQNIRDLCFMQGGLLVREFDEIFSDLFSRKNASHKEIVACLANGSKDLGQICKELKKQLGGGLQQAFRRSCKSWICPEGLYLEFR